VRCKWNDRCADFYHCFREVQTNLSSSSQFYFPSGLSAPDVLPRLVKKDIVIAAGLHKDIKGTHMLHITAELALNCS
jgi:hypothetical protein